MLNSIQNDDHLPNDMSDTASQKCVVIGASHGGINAAFAIRQFGWKGTIEIYDRSEAFPHQKPPLSKAYLLGDFPDKMLHLKPDKAYEKSDIRLHLGVSIKTIDKSEKVLETSEGTTHYDKLVLATGADAFVPGFAGIEQATNVFTIRHLPDSEGLKACVESFVQQGAKPNVVIIGAGYIGLEAASSLSKSCDVTVLEREERVLSRVSAPEISMFYQKLHSKNGVKIVTGTSVSSISKADGVQSVVCENGKKYSADIIIVGVGVKVNSDLAESAGLSIENGIKVNEACQTSDPSIYALGDCTSHYSFIYDRLLRLESVQNAMDQANVVGMHINGKEAKYDKVPWFWSDQYGIKLQIVGLLEGYTDVVVRTEPEKTNSLSVWYFNDDQLIAVDAVNQPRAYMLGMKIIPKKGKVNKSKITSLATISKPEEILVS
ncbi:MAG: FAD/NAD(P)-binding oxidoreductase [Bacteroidota bacterium]